MILDNYNTQELKERFFSNVTSLEDQFLIKQELVKRLNHQEKEAFLSELQIYEAFKIQEKVKVQSLIGEVKNKKTRKLIPKYFLVAASLFLVMGILFTFNSRLNKDTYTLDSYSLMIDDFQKQTLGELSTRGNDFTENEQLKKALKLSLNGQYSESIKLLDSVPIKSESNDLIKLVTCIQYFHQEEYEKSSELLRELVQSNEIKIRQEAEMMQAFVFKKNNNKRRLQTIFDKINSNENHKYYEISKEIIKN